LALLKFCFSGSGLKNQPKIKEKFLFGKDLLKNLEKWFLKL